MAQSPRKLVNAPFVLDNSFFPGKSIIVELLSIKSSIRNYRPETWKLDSIMSLYLEDFKLCRLNSDHNHQKLNFWKELIESYCYHKGSAKVQLGELKQVFKRKGIYPRCLETVINQMILDGNLVEKEEFMKSQQSFTSWVITNLFVRPWFWSAEKIRNNFITNNQDEQKSFIVKSVVNRQSQVFLEFLRNNHASNEAIDIDELMDLSIDLSKDGLPLVLHHLRTEQSVQIDGPSDQEQQQVLLLKICHSNEKVEAITELERSVCRLKRMQRLLLKSLCDKENEMNDTVQRVKTQLKAGQKQLAKSFLRKKHLLEADLKRIESALGNIQTVLHRISASTSDQKILETYKFVSEALKDSFVDSGISLDQVHGIIDEVKEMFHQQEEISDAMRNSFGIPNEDSQLEDELKELINLNVKEDILGSDPEKINIVVDDTSVKTRKLNDRNNIQRGKVHAPQSV